ncbi:hypothetical protein DENSPDRAFT_283174 [Dentipellis sp. KUC8613]|nr:hypothetical protein DENSPDRAFT_283174 [Dentipellis sp. KUC8613]
MKLRPCRNSKHPIILDIWTNFAIEMGPACAKRQDFANAAIARYGCNSQQARFANKCLVDMHCRARQEWHFHLRRAGIHPRDCRGVLKAEHVRYLQHLIGEPVFDYSSRDRV